MNKGNKEFEDNDFLDESESNQGQNFGEEKIRVRLPRGREMIGTIQQRLGGNKMDVLCTDGKTRNCRVPGRLKRELWLRPGDVVIIEPWELDANKGDVLFKYRPNQVAWLKRNGHLEEKSEEF